MKHENSSVQGSRRAIRRAVQVALASSVLAGGLAYADLEAHGPIGNHGYPTWYQDKTGLVLDFCDNKTQAELDGGWCLILPTDIPAGAPEVFPGNFFDEHFYWNAGSGSPRVLLNPLTGTQMRNQLVLGLEGAFATGPVKAGDQMVFTRVRVVVNPIPFDGDYRVYTPYGVFDFPNQKAGDKLFNTVDVGLTPGDFDQALHGNVGPGFLLPSATPGGNEVPPIPDIDANPAVDPFYLTLTNTGANTPYPNNGKRYIADPARLGYVTGAVCDDKAPVAVSHCRLATAAEAAASAAAVALGADPLTQVYADKPAYIVSDGAGGTTLRNPNIFRIEGPGGQLIYEDGLFTLMGRVNEDPIAGHLVTDRASYTANNASPTFDLSAFVTAKNATQGRIPAGTSPTSVPPQLTLFPTPCAVDINGNLAQPAVAGVQMLSKDNLQFSKQIGVNNPVPDSICIEQIGINAASQTVTSFSSHNLTDQVHIIDAIYTPGTAQLVVHAESSDKTKPITLTLDGFTSGLQPADATAPVTLTATTLAPPATVFVRSNEGGATSMQVDTGTLDGTPPVPVAVNDAFPTATVVPTEDQPIDLPVVGNDTGVTDGLITITSQPGGGTATANNLVNPPVIRYTPRANFNGTDSFTYSVSVGGNVSNPATVRLTVASVNDLPVATSDNFGAVVNLPVTLNMLANDTDPDGAADLDGGVYVTGNASLGIVAGASFTGSPVVTPNAIGAQSFSYRARDKAGALSLNTANVNLNVSASDAPALTRAQFTQKTFRWVIDGTTSVSTGQTITLKYTNGTHSPAPGTACVAAGRPGANAVSAAGEVIGTATVNATNAFTYDVILSPTTGSKNPTNQSNPSYWCTTPTGVQGTSSLTNAVTPTQAISLK